MGKKPAPRCPVCGNPAKRIRRADVGMTKYECCGLWAWGRHPLVDADTHRARRAAHAAFDPLWQRMGMSRGEAYRRLALALDLDEPACHMKVMSAETARRVPAAVAEILADIRLELAYGGA